MSNDRKPFTPEEVHRICLAIDQLRQFTEGYLHTRRLDCDPRASPHLRLFMGAGLITYLDGFYENRRAGLLPILRLVGFNRAADGIEQALDTPIGPKRFGEIQRALRNKHIAHPQFDPKCCAEVVEAHRHIKATGDTFRNADRQLKTITASLFPMFEKYFPQLVEETNRWLRITEGLEDPT